MKKDKRSNSLITIIFGIIGFIVLFVIASLISDNFIISVVGGLIGYWQGKKVGNWISAKTAKIIGMSGGVALLSMQFLGFKVFELIVEKIIEAMMF